MQVGDKVIYRQVIHTNNGPKYHEIPATIISLPELTKNSSGKLGPLARIEFYSKSGIRMEQKVPRSKLAKVNA